MITSTGIENISELHDLVKGFLNGTLKEIMARLQAERGSLFLFDPDRDELILDACYTPANLKIKGLRQRANEGVSGAVVHLKTAVLVKDIQRDSRFKSNGFRQYHTPSFISVPLYVNSSLIGVMHIADKSCRGAFTESDFVYSTNLCRYACLIVGNLCSFVQLRKEKVVVDRQKTLLQQYAAVGKMAQEIVHHINNPLDGTIRFANILMRHVDEEDQAREPLGLISEGLRRIGSITGALREFGSQVGSAVRIASPAVSVNQVIDDALALFGQRFGHDGITLSRQFQDGLPRVCNHGLEHLFTNMIKNALDAMPSGGTLTIATAVKNGSLCIEFADTGCGVAPAVRDLIFEPFFTTKPIGQGTGMGLAICREIVEQYNGTIRLKSGQGCGCVFLIELPLAKAAKERA